MMDDQLKMLYDYTKFHIGMYTTLVTAIIAVFANDNLRAAYSNFVVTAHPPFGQNAITSPMPADPAAGERVGRHGAIEPSG
jgi:hypothetical protein